MSPTLFNRVVVTLMLVVTVVGLVDGAAGRVWDHVALHAAVLVGTLLLLIVTALRRRLVPVRADLYRWLAEYAAEGAEDTDAVLDRALSAYRDGLTTFAAEQQNTEPPR